MSEPMDIDVSPPRGLLQTKRKIDLLQADDEAIDSNHAYSRSEPGRSYLVVPPTAKRVIKASTGGRSGGTYSWWRIFAWVPEFLRKPFTKPAREIVVSEMQVLDASPKRQCCSFDDEPTYPINTFPSPTDGSSFSSRRPVPVPVKTRPAEMPGSFPSESPPLDNMMDYEYSSPSSSPPRSPRSESPKSVWKTKFVNRYARAVRQGQPLFKEDEQKLAKGNAKAHQEGSNPPGAKSNNRVENGMETPSLRRSKEILNSPAGKMLLEKRRSAKNVLRRRWGSKHQKHEAKLLEKRREFWHLYRDDHSPERGPEFADDDEVDEEALKAEEEAHDALFQLPPSPVIEGEQPVELDDLGDILTMTCFVTRRRIGIPPPRRPLAQNAQAAPQTTTQGVQNATTTGTVAASTPTVPQTSTTPQVPSNGTGQAQAGAAPLTAAGQAQLGTSSSAATGQAQAVTAPTTAAGQAQADTTSTTEAWPEQPATVLDTGMSALDLGSSAVSTNVISQTPRAAQTGIFIKPYIPKAKSSPATVQPAPSRTITASETTGQMAQSNAAIAPMMQMEVAQPSDAPVESPLTSLLRKWKGKARKVEQDVDLVETNEKPDDDKDAIAQELKEVSIDELEVLDPEGLKQMKEFNSLKTELENQFKNSALSQVAWCEKVEDFESSYPQLIGDNRVFQAQREIPVIREIPAAALEEFEKAKLLSQRSTTSISSANDVNRHDLETLIGNSGWLNDKVIEVFLEAVVARKESIQGREQKKPGIAPRSVAFNAYFYKKSSQDGFGPLERLIKRKGLDEGRVMECDWILIPINHTGSHWTLLVISPTAMKVAYYDSMSSGDHDHFKRYAFSFLRKFVGPDFDEGEWVFEGGNSVQQTNGRDCGAFVCLNALAVLSGWEPSQALKATDVPQGRQQIAAVLAHGGFDDGYDYNWSGLPAVSPVQS